MLCQSREDAEAALAQIQAWTVQNALRVHPDKTHLGNCREAGYGFDFLGYRLRGRTSLCTP
ncbi:MAG: hypothetical protein ACREKR_13445 [Candidatus Methylomirabilales bacterium]